MTEAENAQAHPDRGLPSERDTLWLSAIVETSADAVFLVRCDGLIASWNRGAREMFGYESEEIRGKPVTMLAPEEGRADMLALYRRVMEGETIRNAESWRRRKDGSLFAVVFTLAPLKTPSDGVCAVSVILRDVSQEKRIEAALHGYESARAEEIEAQAEILRSITDNASLGLVMTDDRQRCTFMNPAAERIFGIGFDAVKGSDEPLHNFVHHTHPDGSPFPVSECPIHRVLTKRMRQQGQETFVRPDGTFYPVAFTASPIYRGGRSIGTVVEVEDLTNRRKEQQELTESNERLALLARATAVFMEPKLGVNALFERLLAELVPSQGQSAAVMVLSRDQQFVEVPAFRHADKEAEEHGMRVFGGRPLRKEDALGATVFETGEALLLPRFGASSMAVLSNPELSAYLSLYPVGSYLAVPLRTTRGVIGVLGISRAASGIPFSKADQDLFQDIAGRAALALEAARAYAEAQDAIRLRDEFLSTASHELRTPLTALLLQLQGIHKLQQHDGPTDTDRLQRKLDTAIRQTHRMTALVEDLLDVTNLSRGRPRLFREPLELLGLLRDTIEKSSAYARKNGSEIRLEGTPVNGQWDPRRLEQVFTNLIANAVKYGAQNPIEIHVEERGDTAEVSVSDRGIGIDPKLFKRIFERFGRGVSSTHYGGLGLGLYIAKQIVAAHGGTIRVESEISKGSTFCVSLPKRPPQDASEDETVARGI